MALPRNNILLFAAVAAIVVVAGFLAVSARASSCPVVPPSITAGWSLLDKKDGMLIYDVNLPASSVYRNILSSISRIYYVAYHAHSRELNLPLPDLPQNADSVYMLTVPTRCGAETLAIIGSGKRSRVYVGVVPITSSTRLTETNALFCEHLAGKIGDYNSFSELTTEELNRTIHYCFIVPNSDYNSVLSRVESLGSFVGSVGGIRFYRMDDNTIVRLANTVPVGVVAYREKTGPSQ